MVAFMAGFNSFFFALTFSLYTFTLGLALSRIPQNNSEIGK
jgi:hypothetical protein